MVNNAYKEVEPNQQTMNNLADLILLSQENVAQFVHLLKKEKEPKI